MGNERRNRKWEKMGKDGKMGEELVVGDELDMGEEGMNNKKCYLFCDTHSLV